MTVDPDRYYDDGPLVVRTEAVGDVDVTFRPVEAAGNRIDDPAPATVGRDEFERRFRRL